MGTMSKTNPTEAELQTLEQGWLELGQSIAETVVAGGKGPKWAWELIGPLGIYKRWMLEKWIQRYQDEHPEQQNPDQTDRSGSKRKRKPPGMQSKFTKREQIHEALRLLNAQNGR